jgi:hypothetical protein
MHISNLLLTFGGSLPQDELIYLNRSIEGEFPFAYFYITVKVHKKAWKTCPIVSVESEELL